MVKANLAARLIALIIDSVIVWIAGAIIGLVLGEEVLGIGVSFVIGLLYNSYFWTMNNGQTPGKGMLDIRVVSRDGGGVNLVQAVVRYIGYYINTLILLLGWLWAIVDGNNQGLHDKLAGTIVVKA